MTGVPWVEPRILGREVECYVIASNFQVFGNDLAAAHVLDIPGVVR
jgi:hypothetical protein